MKEYDGNKFLTKLSSWFLIAVPTATGIYFALIKWGKLENNIAIPLDILLLIVILLIIGYINKSREATSYKEQLKDCEKKTRKRRH